jgi:hypothetical protein
MNNISVRALTVPMHLDLITGPFVTHNLISTQCSPVTLLKFQMTPSDKVKNEWNYTCKPSICLSGVDWDLFLLSPITEPKDLNNCIF